MSHSIAERMAGVEVYYFSSETCAPCRTIKPTIEELKEDYAYVPWKLMNIVADKDLTEKMGVTSIPAMVITKDGNEVARHTGSTLIGYYNILRRNCPNPLTI